MINFPRSILFSVFFIITCNSDNGLNSVNNTGSLMVENCEDNDSRNLLGGYWYACTDSSKGGASAISIYRDENSHIKPCGKGYNSKYSFHMSYRLSKGNYSMNPFVICGMRLSADNNSIKDLTEYAAVSYFFKGPAHSVRIETANVKDFCYHSFSVDSSSNWKKVTVPFSSLSQPFWGTSVSFDKSDATGISWQIYGQNSDSSDIFIDDVSLEKDTASDIIKLTDDIIEIPGADFNMTGYLYPPKESGKFPVIILLPGGTSTSNTGTVYEHHKYFGTLFSSKGIAVLVLDYHYADRSFLDTLQIYDIGKAVDYVKHLSYIDNKQVFLAGLSLGGANALRVAGSRNDIAGTICYFSPVDWRVYGSDKGLKKQPIEYCKDINCPVLILQGDSDRVTDVSQSRMLQDTLESLGRQSELVIYSGAAHGFTYEGAPAGNCIYNKNTADSSYVRVEEFIRKTVDSR